MDRGNLLRKDFKMPFRLCLFLIALTTIATAEESDFLSRTRQLTFEGRRSGEGYFNPEGDRLVFQSERSPDNPFYQIYTLDLTTGETRRVSPGVGKTTCAFFQPGAGNVLFASTHLDPQSEKLQQEELDRRAEGRERRYAWDYDPHFDLFLAPADGGEFKRLTEARGYDAEGAFSPDGERIVFCSTRSAYPLDKLSDEARKRAELNPSYFGEIYLMKADGSSIRRLTHTAGYDGGPFFSPDGERIIWRRFDEEGMLADIYTMKLDGSDVRRLTDFDSMSWAPYFHPSGDYAIFASNKHGFENFELFIVDAAGKKEPVRVTTTPGFDGLPVFSPEGNRLCWTSTRYAPESGRTGGQLYLARWDDAAARKALADAPLRVASPASRPASQPTSRPAETAGQADAASVSGSEANDSTDITIPELEEMVVTLASEKMEGRMTGTEGEEAAAHYIESKFREAGLQTLPGMDSYRQEFTFTAGVNPGPENTMSVKRIEANPHIALEERLGQVEATTALEAEKDFMPLSISDEATTAGLVAFAGYGLVVPDGANEPRYDSYGDLDVEGRMVVILRYVPEDVSPEIRQVYNRYAGLRYKALQARERGAAGLLVVTGPNSPGSGDLVPVGLDFGGVSSGILAASITVETANRLLQSSGRSLEALQTELDSGEPVDGFTLEDTYVEANIDLEKERRQGVNLLGYLPGVPVPDPETELDMSEIVVLGAHYDHLGRGQSGSSLARKGEQDAIHYGADDNASGIAVLVEIAEQMAAGTAPRQRGTVFAAWSGEELGLLGSSRFTEDPPVDLARIVAYLNMDMVGRVRENQLAVQGVGSSTRWRSMLERHNVPAGFSLALSEDPYLPTDVTSFYLQEIPALSFFSGAHEDYHRPTDTPEKIAYGELQRVARFVKSVAESLAETPTPPAYTRVARPERPSGGDRDTLRAYLGTIPDYTTEGVEGVMLSGVRADGPADRGGLRGGDIIKRFAGQEITNIYDYTYALDAVKIGEPVEVIVERDGRNVTLTVTPEPRE